MRVGFLSMIQNIVYKHDGVDHSLLRFSYSCGGGHCSLMFSHHCGKLNANIISVEPRCNPRSNLLRY